MDRRTIGRSALFFCSGLLLSSALLSPGCGANEGAQPASGALAASGASEATSGSPDPGPVAAPPPAEVEGAAAALPEPELPEDTVALASRVTPRELPIPRVGNGRTARFTFDGHHRGWFARTPDGRQKLVSPIYGDGKVYLGGGFTSHRFYALDARTGDFEWAAAAPDGGPTAAIIEDGMVYFNTESCTLFAVDAETGRQRWSRWLGDPLMSQPSASRGRVFSGHIRDDGGYGFTAMRADNGRVLWTRRISADVMNAAILDEENLYFTTMDGTVWALSQQNGRLLWRRPMHATSAPWLRGEEVHVSVRAEPARDEEGRRVLREKAVVLSKAEGAPIREQEPVEARFLGGRPDAGGVPAGWGYEGSRATVVDGRIYQTIGNEVQSRDAETGRLLWRRLYTTDTRQRPASSPAVAGGQLVFGTRDGVLFGLDIDTGLTAWAYDVGEPISAQPVVAHGWVYASTTRGGVVGLEVSEASFDGWHMWGGDARHAGPVDAADADGAAPEEEEERPGEGALRLASAPRAGELAGFPLERTEVRATVRGFVARVEVTQTFTNPFERPVEATYLFPLPGEAAVDGMTLRAGDRVIQGQIRRREQARAEYRRARDRGLLATILEQERPDLFRQTIANVRPGDSVQVTLAYTHPLPYEAGAYELVYPMVAGPRYARTESNHNSDHNNSTNQTNNTANQTDNIHQAILAPGEERPDRVHFEIDAELAGAIRRIHSPTHSALRERREGGTARVRSPEEGLRPDRDLVLRFEVAGDEPSIHALASPPSEGSGYFTLLIHPRREVEEAELSPRELVFLIDASSSMHGRPMELAKAAAREALSGMRPGDTFRLLAFSDTATRFSEAALPATLENIGRASAWVEALRPLGATEMGAGLRAALAPEAEPGRLRYVVLLTDGYIGEEREVFREVRARLGQARLFSFGVGSAVNRYLLGRLAELGRGEAQVVTLDEPPEAAARAFHARIARPFLTDLSLSFGDLEVSEVYPRRLPDLFADRPVVVHGRYAQGGRGQVTLRGRIAGRPFEQQVEVSLPEQGEAQPALASIWARTRVRDLMLAMALRPNEALREEVTSLGLEHHLLTEWTAFVAIDEGYHVDRPATDRVEQATEAPAGMTPRSNVHASRPATRSLSVGAGSSGTLLSAPRPMPMEAMEAMEPMAQGASSSVGALRGYGGGGGVGAGRTSVRIDALEGDFEAGADRASSTASPTASPTAGPTTERAQDARRRPAQAERSVGAPAGLYARCLAQATLPDGSVDGAALRACLEAGRGGGGARKGGGRAAALGSAPRPQVASTRWVSRPKRRGVPTST